MTSGDGSRYGSWQRTPKAIQPRSRIKLESHSRRRDLIGFVLFTSVAGFAAGALPAGAAQSTTASGSTASAPASAPPERGPAAKDNALQPLAAAASGAVQGIAQNLAKQLVLHPFDTVKTRIQVKNAKELEGGLFNDLYRGLLPTLVGGTPGSAAFFAAKEAATSSLLAQGAVAPVPTLGGVVAGVLAAKSVRTPFDVAETRAMAAATSGGSSSGQEKSDRLSWDGSWAAVSEVYRQEGIPGLYRGYGANVAYKLPADAAKFLAYEGLRAGGADKALSPPVAGAAATLLASAATTPLDVVRTRVLVGTSSRGPIETLQGLLKEEPEKLWAGLGWRIARGIVAGSIQFSVLEGTKSVVEGVAKK